ncbi:MAG: O-antigen ligase family protein [Chitinophagales bacterium]|nr:O-antigen ligase family protein [Chitinophagales bacterium]MDW8393618.1 O-antigen ligase family protein [Chitinophagales bacterium]
MASPTARAGTLWFYGFAAVLLVSWFAAICTEEFALALVAPVLLFVFVSINDLKFVYLLLWMVLPLSTEMDLPYGFATDFPSELLIGGLMLLFFPFVLSRPDAFPRDFLKHPLIFLLLLHYVWIWISTLYSEFLPVSLKFSLAKTWYIVTFVFVTALLIRSSTDFRKAFGLYLLPLLFTVVYTMVRHAESGFAFATVNDPMRPFYRNHVAYACVLAQSVPLYIWFSNTHPFLRRHRLIAWSILLLLLAAIALAYTRSAWVSLIVAAMAYPLIRLRLLTWAVAGAFLLAVAFFVYMALQGRYLNYQPDFERTVYHPELADHLEATFEGRDVSSAERIYRWVAAFRMWEDQPLTGFGPSNFYNFYKKYTVTGFRTWVSENTERSSVHNYFLQLLTEQGIIGLLLFLLLTLGIFATAQRVYTQCVSPQDRNYVMAITLALVIIYVNNTLSDLIETDKIGSLFFICIALLVHQDLANRNQHQCADRNSEHMGVNRTGT